MATILSSDNTYSGGIIYQTPALQLGNFSNAAPNGGFSFDIPLSTVANINQQAMNFTSANSARNSLLLGAVYGNAQASVDNTANQAMSFANSGLGVIANNAQLQQASINNLFHQFLGTSQFIAQKGVETTQAANPKKKGCFITTAICEGQGKPDDCDELETLRAFRDDFMSSKRPDLLREYYETAPAIVEKIAQKPESQFIYDMLRTRFLEPAITAVKAGDNEKALTIYAALFVVAKSAAQ